MDHQAAGERFTVGELARRLERMEQESQAGFSSLHRRLDELNYVHPETLDTKLLLEAAHRSDIERRVSELAAANREREKEAATTRRLVITALVAPVVVGVVVALIVAAVLGSP